MATPEGEQDLTLVLEVKGFEDNLTTAKHEGARRWVRAVNNWGKLGRWAFHVWTQLEAKLIPDPFLTPEEVKTAASACTRTGLVATIGGTWDQAVTFTTTPRLTKLLELAPIEDVLGRDRASRR